MNKGLLIFFMGLVTGIIIISVSIILLLPKQMIIVKESKLGFDETVETIKNSAAENSWSVPHTYDLQGTMKKHGYEVSPVKVFSLCKPEYAYQILGSSNERFVSALMPCRVAVYDNDGKTYVSMLNAGLFSRFMGKKISNAIGEASLGNNEILESVIK